MKTIPTLIMAIFAVQIHAQLQSPRVSPLSEVKQTIGLSEVTVKYNRPAVRDREVFGGLIPYGKRWRTGANENTTITFSDPVDLGNETLAAGTYALYTQPDTNQWEIIFYSDASNWGMPRNWDDDKVAFSLTAPSETHDFVESFTIGFENVTLTGADLTLSWENTKVRVPFSVPTDEKMQAEIQRVMAGAPKAGDYYTAAVYHLNHDLDLKKAKQWIEKAVQMRSDAFWYHRQKSLIHYKSGEKEAAVAAAQTSLELAQKAGNQNYVRINQAQLEEWGMR
ncbi:MAG: DUF2911 domain-containing protein [Flavobacteriaceae bacterium]